MNDFRTTPDTMQRQSMENPPGLPALTSPLTRFNELRPRVLDEVGQRTMGEFAHAKLDLLLGEVLYSERLRLKRDRPNWFTR